MKKRSRSLGNCKKNREIDFDGYFEELKKFKALRKKIDFKNTYEGIFCNKDIDSCEEILIRKYMLYELRDTYDYDDDLSSIITGIFNNMPDKELIKKERKDDTTFCYYEPKTKKFPDGIIGENFCYFGSDNDGEWVMKTLDTSDCISMFRNTDEYSRGKTLWVKFNKNKSLDDIEKIAHNRVLELKKKEKKEYDVLSAFEKALIEVDKNKEIYLKSLTRPYSRNRIKEDVDKIESEYNKQLAFSYFPELLELEIIKKISRKYKLDIESAKYMFRKFSTRNFSNKQWNNALKHYSMERKRNNVNNDKNFYYHSYSIENNEFYN